MVRACTPECLSSPTYLRTPKQGFAQTGATYSVRADTNDENDLGLQVAGASMRNHVRGYKQGAGKADFTEDGLPVVVLLHFRQSPS